MTVQKLLKEFLEITPPKLLVVGLFVLLTEIFARGSYCVDAADWGYCVVWAGFPIPYYVMMDNRGEYFWTTVWPNALRDAAIPYVGSLLVVYGLVSLVLLVKKHWK